MDKTEKDKLVKELESKGYKPWKDCFRHNYYSWIRTFNKGTDDEYYIAFRNWDYTQYRDQDKQLIDNEFSFDVEIRFGINICSLELGYPNVCNSIEKAEETAIKLMPILKETVNLKHYVN